MTGSSHTIRRTDITPWLGIVGLAWFAIHGVLRMPSLTRSRWGRWLAGAGLCVSLAGCLSPDGPDRPTIAEFRQPPSVTREQGPLAQPKAQPPKLEVPPGLPGSHVPFPPLPPDTPETKAARLKAIDALFPMLPDLGPDPLVDPQAGVAPVSLEELLEFAKRHSPTIAQAAADVEQARGQWVQAGLYPNPTAGYQADQVANSGSAGQQGGFFNQTIITGGKLKLARSVAYYDFANAQLKLRRAEIDLTRQVRADYYAALVAAENVRISRLISEFTATVYEREVQMVRGGTAAPFEAAALRAVVGQSRTNLITARNRYVSAWKQLAASVNAPDMPPGPLAGRVSEAVPRYHYDALQARLLAVHTDLAVAQNQITQAESQLRLQQVKPVPDVENNLYFQRDTQLQSFQMGIQMGVQVPVWNRNQGAISAAVAQLTRTTRERERVRNDLIRQLAAAFERYESGRQQLAIYRDEILPDLVRAFRGVYQRYEVEPDKVNYNDIVTAQQNLSARLIDYLQLLRQQWEAAVDLAGIVQADRLDELPTDPGPDSWPSGFGERRP